MTISPLSPASISGRPAPGSYPDSRHLAAQRRREAALAGLMARQMPLPQNSVPRFSRSSHPGTPSPTGPSAVPSPTVRHPADAHRGRPQMPPPIAPVQARHRRPMLTAREIEVLLAWLRHDSKSGAADELGISAGTVNTHLSRIRAKYCAADRPARTKVALAARAIQDGLITLDEL